MARFHAIVVVSRELRFQQVLYTVQDQQDKVIEIIESPHIPAQCILHAHHPGLQQLHVILQVFYLLVLGLVWSLGQTPCTFSRD